MKENRKKVADFLQSYQMYYEDIDMEENVQIFLSEMEKGLTEEGSSLQMIPTYIEVRDKIPVNEKVIAIDAGGTNFRVALITFDKEKKPYIQSYKKVLMPGVNMEVSKETFFKTFADYLSEVINESSRIGFCFSFPTEIFPNKDGRLIDFCKEIKAKEVIGELIGDNLLIAIKKLGYKKDKQVVILNDTVAALLAGNAFSQGRIYDSYIGFILGTGMNCCYVESNRNIKKKPDLEPTKSQIINIETGSYGRGPNGEIDRKYDITTINPGLYTYEKMISGAYFGSLCLETLKTAAKDGLFSSTISQKLFGLKKINIKDVNDYITCPTDSNKTISKIFHQADKNDSATAYFLFDDLIERAARLSAICLSTVVIKSGAGANPCYPVCISAEGATFYKFNSLKARIEAYLDGYLKKRMNRYYQNVKIKNAPLIGAAIAGLTN